MSHRYVLTKEIEFDAGHRVPLHDSKCSNPHGHRYKVECAIGAYNLVSSGSSTGMVLDFGHVKQLLVEKVHDVFDHGFIVYAEDTILWEALFGAGQSWRLIVFPYVPTAENLARWIFDTLRDPISEMYNQSAELVSITVWETPTSKARYGYT